MKMQTLILTFATFTVLAACDRSKPAPAPPAPAPVAEAEKPQPSQCDLKTASYRNKPNLANESVQQVSIERHFQRVVRKDCTGKVVSDQIETVLPPHGDIDLKPARRLNKKAGYVQIFDSETCTERGTRLPNRNTMFLGGFKTITGDEEGKIKVKGDMAEAWLTFKVTQSANHLYYSYFENCKNLQDTSICDPENEIASGIYNVFVTYTEKTLPGTNEMPVPSCEKKN